MEGYRSCQRALENLADVCERYLPGHHSIEVIDVAVNPEVAASEDILAVPTVIRTAPLPALRIIGDLSDRETCMRLLGISDHE